MKVALSAVNPEDRGGAWILNKKATNLRVALNEQLRTFLKDGTTQKMLEKWNPADDAQPVIDWLNKYYAANPLTSTRSSSPTAHPGQPRERS